MKKLLLLVFAALAFAACTQDVVVDITPAPIVDEVPETLVVGFEGDDTRIQLQNGKTVWTQGDQVSVFYKSDANQKWQYNGETGSRTAELKRVDAGVASARMDRVVVAYPYSDNYLLNLTTGDIEATMPAVQTYMKDSYGLDGNIMVASSYFTQFNLKNVCGWLKLQLTGDGEVVKSIKLRGNNGEQVAGLIYVDTENATSILASEMGDVTEDEGENITGGTGGNLVFDDTILTEVTLNCGEGVTLGKSATAFYIALPPQTFEQGFTVDIECDNYKPMTLLTTNTLTIERNHIQPMASVEHNAPPVVPNNQIWYTSSDGNVVTPNNTNVFGANIISNTYDNGMGVITFDGDVTTIGYEVFRDCTSLTSVNIPDSVTTIGDHAFADCSSLTSVNIPDSVTTIGDHAFVDCSSLTSVNIPDSVMTIGRQAFALCTSLTSVTIPDSVTTIGHYAFYSCESLTSVNIGDSVTTIGDYAFRECTSLKEFKGKYATEDGRSLIMDNTIIAYAYASGTTYTIPDSVTTIGDEAFYGCDSLTSVTIGDSVTEIGYHAFYSCGSLASVNIGDSVTTIGNYAFYYCTSLTSVNIGDSVTTIGNDAFCYCTSLKYVYCKATTPPALGNSNVFDYNASGRRIIVPIGSGEAYKTATYWSEYANVIFEDEF